MRNARTTLMIMNSKFDLWFYWDAHPYPYVRNVMSNDFSGMNRFSFLLKYIDIMEEDDTPEEVRKQIRHIVLPLYEETVGRKYDVNLIAL